MLPEESPEAKYDRLKRQLQDSILSEYPNPERKGCPGDAVIRSLAARASDESVEKDPNWHHVTHCSECYREFLDLRLKLKSEAKRRARLVGWGVVAAVVALAAGLFFVFEQRKTGIPERPQNAELAWDKTMIDIPSMTRSETGSANAPIVLKRRAEELTMNLPVGSKAGLYELRLLKGDKAIISATSTAALVNGATSFTVRIDLSKVAAGSYSMSVRQAPWDWSYFPVVVR
jgi:hypothetical protein